MKINKLIQLILNSHYWDFFIIYIIYLFDVFVQNHSLGKSVDVFTDAGVFLYSAKLISEGLVPFKDFFLSNSSFLIYFASLGLKIVNFNMIHFNFIYMIWLFSSIIPIYFIVLRLTQNRVAAIISIILFSTFPELVQWDAHSFALRQASLPFLSFALFFIFTKRYLLMAGILLAFFALSIPTNIPISLSLILTILLGEFIFENKNIKKIATNNIHFLLGFFITLICGSILILLPQNSFQNIFGYQLNRPFFPYQYRIDLLKGALMLNWPILLLGLLGSLIINKKTGLFGLFNISALLIVLFAGSSFYPHYITVFAVGFAISSGIFLGTISRSSIESYLISLGIICILYSTCFSYLQYHLIEKANPNFFEVVQQLKNTPTPLFTFEPIYGMYAQKSLTYHYYTADMRYFRVEGKNLSETDYLNIFNKSNTILIQNSWGSFMPTSSIEYINHQFRLKYSDPENQLFIRNGYE